MKKRIVKILEQLESFSDQEKLELTRAIQKQMYDIEEPISNVHWIPVDKIIANTYNPNKMAVPEKRLLLKSMHNHGITYPLVATKRADGFYELIDGYHRFQLITKCKTLRARLKCKVPVVLLSIPENECIVATIRHNRARGKHQIDKIGDVVKTLAKKGWATKSIMEELGMDADEVLRLKQFRGLGELFKDSDYSNSWI